MIVEPLTAAHALALVPQTAQPEALADLRDAAKVAQLCAVGTAIACIADGRVVAIGGIADAGGGRGIGWCALASDIARFMPSLTRVAARHLAASGFRRIEIATRGGWLNATRWALKLGFTFEGPSPGYYADGGEAYRWGRVR